MMSALGGANFVVLGWRDDEGSRGKSNKTLTPVARVGCVEDSKKIILYWALLLPPPSDDDPFASQGCGEQMPRRATHSR